MPSLLSTLMISIEYIRDNIYRYPRPPDRGVSAKLKTPRTGCFFCMWFWQQQIGSPKSCMRAVRQVAGFSVDFASIFWWIMTENTHVILSAHCMKIWIMYRLTQIHEPVCSDTTIGRSVVDWDISIYFCTFFCNLLCVDRARIRTVHNLLLCA